MSKSLKQNLFFFGLLILLMLPNLVLVLLARDTAVYTPLKQIVFFAYTLSFILFFISFIKPKIFFALMFLVLPFALVDLYILFLTGTQSTAMHYTAVFVTNFEEAKELVSGNISNLLLAFLFIGLYIWLFVSFDKNFRLNKKIKRLIGSISLLIIVGLFIRDYVIAKKERISGKTLALAMGFFEIKLDKTYPFGAVNKISKVINGAKEQHRFNKNNKNFSYQVKIVDNTPKTLVLVIGEAARKHNFQLYGYPRKTNPELSKIDNLIRFSDVTTNANFTQTSFPQIITSVGPKSYNQRYNETGIVAAFKEAGYHTYWITNQPYYPNSLYYLYAHIADYYKDVSSSFDVISYDDKLLPVFTAVLNDNNKKRLIVLHTIGSHYRYNLRYPTNFEKFKPALDGSISTGSNSAKYKELYINAYDNSILYTDHILSKLIHTLSLTKEPALLMYLSDHGENLFDDSRELFLHGTAAPSKYELEIPLLVWTSDNYPASAVTKLRKASVKKLSSEIVFHTFSSLGGFKTNHYNASFDLLSDSLQSGNRLFLKPDERVLNIDAEDYVLKQAP